MKFEFLFRYEIIQNIAIINNFFGIIGRRFLNNDDPMKSI